MTTKRLLLLSSALLTMTVVVLLAHTLVTRAVSTKSWDYLGNYTTWSVNASNNGSSLMTVLASAAEFAGMGSSGYNWITPNKFAFVDISGDGLVDFVYHEKENTGFATPSTFTALFLNDGTNNFRLAFKCLHHPATSDNNYYGDCAQGAPQRDPNAPENQNMRSTVKLLMQYASSDIQSGDHTPYASIWVDINGDGLQDFFNQNCLYINSGVLNGAMFSNAICN